MTQAPIHVLASVAKGIIMLFCIAQQPCSAQYLDTVDVSVPKLHCT